MDKNIIDEFNLRFKDIPLAAALSRRGSCFEAVNAAFCSLLGYKEDELTALRPSDISHPGDYKREVERIINMKQNEEESLRLDKRYIHRRGDIIHCRCVFFPFGSEGHVAGLIEDYSGIIDEYRSSNSEMDKLKRSDSVKSSLISGIAKELREPLHMILSYSAFGIERLDKVSSEKIRRYFKNIDSAAKDILRFSNELFDLGTLSLFEKLETGTADIYGAVMKSVDETTDNYPGFVLDIERPPGEVTGVVCDSAKLERIVTILLDNAASLSGEKKRCRAEIEKDPENDTRIILSFRSPKCLESMSYVELTEMIARDTVERMGGWLETETSGGEYIQRIILNRVL
ncbi:sensor histidine kinase [Limisalsivibrio acetivorans]|uniref:sensor histidine kinase n=1 Tax=Limisalsivibrio acetivorans TaxID=1304888 RepID=UPI0003B46893|nr:PAS domain S-box protein [Limisalsivibrio acetivorans]